jgi:flagellar biosynthetic protein FliQ
MRSWHHQDLFLETFFMLTDQAIDVVRETLSLMLQLSLPVLAAALVVGLTVSVLQAVTQIQEQTLSFVPKIVGMGVMAIVAIPWMVTRIMEFATRMFSGT